MPRANKKAGRGSSTPGKSKGQNCQRSEKKNLHAKDSRLYRTNPALYAACCLEVDSMKGNRLGAKQSQ